MAVARADFIIPDEIENQIHNVNVLVRPGMVVFLQRFDVLDVVGYTARYAKYADLVLDMLDTHRIVEHRLFREACTHEGGIMLKYAEFHVLIVFTPLGRWKIGCLVGENGIKSHFVE
ncbi:hypothetical protein HDV00_012331 [Rhizophlyctis rosea]|nr:hypothetical protein HDV00_012331 [Rhizophlyctis rosea]